MIQIVPRRNLSLVIACSDGMRWVRGDTSIPATDGKIKAPTAVGRMWLVGQRFSAAWLQERLALSFESTATSTIQAPAARTEPASFHELAR
jgi:hypothetical protein